MSLTCGVGGRRASPGLRVFAGKFSSRQPSPSTCRPAPLGSGGRFGAGRAANRREFNVADSLTARNGAAVVPPSCQDDLIKAPSVDEQRAELGGLSLGALERLCWIIQAVLLNSTARMAPGLSPACKSHSNVNIAGESSATVLNK
jgi:hypothetical protein